MEKSKQRREEEEENGATLRHSQARIQQFWY